MDRKFKDKVVLITGASDGIGAAIGKHFGELSANVALNYFRGEERVENVAAEIREKGGEAKVTRKRGRTETR